MGARIGRIRRILVAVKDPGARNSPALLKAVQLARALDAELLLFHAIAVPLYANGDLTLVGEGLADVERTAREGCVERLEALAKSLRRQVRQIRVSAQWDYPIYEAVIREAVRTRANLIVAERHAGWHAPRAFLRLTDWELLRLSPVPVLLVKSASAYRRPAILAAVDPAHRYAKPQRLDRKILGLGSSLATALKGSLHAMYAYVPVPVAAYAHGTTDEDIARMRAQTARNAREKLRGSTHFLALPNTRLHVIARNPPDAIEEAAAETHSALVVMGAISRHGFKRLLFGNTAERVLDHLPCDLLIVKPPIQAVPRARRGVKYIHDPDLYVLK